MKIEKVLPGIAVKFRLGWRDRIVFGGSFLQVRNITDRNLVKVKMAVEIKQQCDIDIPTKDYDVPLEVDMKLGVYAALQALASGKIIYVGCLGGIGRTGLFLGVLAKVLCKEDPVVWVRKHFKSHAIETSQQVFYVNSIDVSELQLIAQRLNRKLLWQFWK